MASRRKTKSTCAKTFNEGLHENQKPRNGHLSGGANHFHTSHSPPQKMRSSLTCTDHVVFLTFMELCIMNFFHKHKVQANINTLTPYGICTKMCGKNKAKSRISGIGFSTRTRHLHTCLICTYISGNAA